MNPLHILGQYGKENAAAIFELFMECMPEYPLDKPDPNGNTSKLCLLKYSSSFYYYHVMDHSFVSYRLSSTLVS